MEYYTKKDIGNIKPIHTLDGYNFKKDKYWCSSIGDVYIKKEENKYHKMKPYITRDGYVEYVLSEEDGKKRHIQGHRLVAKLFIPNPKRKPHVNHNDGNRQNNKMSNLKWMTVSENAIHSYRKLGKKPNNKK